MPTPTHLSGWLEYIAQIHPKSIALGLDRVAEVMQRMRMPPAVPVITVGGTNGKGSTCAMLEAILLAAGFRVGLYTSPHLIAYNERVRVNGRPVSDGALCEAFARVEQARQDTILTYFEFGTLAAGAVFAEVGLDALVLEVGMGGRLDAVNAFDTDCAIVTSIGIDHTEFLGDNREQIGFEKAGIFRVGRPAIIGDPDPPKSLTGYAREIGAVIRRSGEDFGFRAFDDHWEYWDSRGGRLEMPFPALGGERQIRNASVCLAALDALSHSLPVNNESMRRGLTSVEWPGRFQILPGKPTVILDVSHNPEAVAVLAQNLDALPVSGQTHAVFGMLRDKDIAAVCRLMANRVNVWYPATIDAARGADAEELAASIRSANGSALICPHGTPLAAFDAASRHVVGDDRILVFGSFYTVADVMGARSLRGH